VTRAGGQPRAVASSSAVSGRFACSNAASVVRALIQLPVLGLIAISGIFYPITALPDWLEWIGQLSPIYWMGLGMRSALLPDSAVVVELDGSWRHLETAAVLGVLAVVGLAVAPVVLRRMARRESGSKVAERRERALQRVA
jgi:ABC-2 type transport system permease protein